MTEIADVRTPRTIPAGVVAVVCLLGAAAVYWHLFEMPIWDKAYGLFGNGIDLRVYRGGGFAVWNDRPLYDAPVYRVWDFTYTPFAALVMVPLAFLSIPHAETLMHVVNLVALVLFVFLSLRALNFRRDGRFWLTLAAFSVGATIIDPIHSTIWQGQINLVLGVLVLGCLTLPMGRWRGIGVGLAAGIKLTPMFFVLYLAITRRWRAVAVTVLTFAATVVLGLIVLRGEAWEYWTVTLHETSRIGPETWPQNQSINGFFDRLRSTGVWRSPNWIWLPVSTVVALSALWAALRAHRAGAELLAISIVGMASCGVGPFAWQHHWVWLAPLLLVGIVQAVDATRRARPLTWLWWLAPLALMLLAYSWVQVFPDKTRFGSYIRFWTPHPHGWSGVLTVVTSGAYPLVLIVTIALTLWWTRGRTAQTRQAAGDEVAAA
ncbi:MAG: glycosyltransferase 87 family protein [Gordonia sp. (in: high G+C Gram-positive bacteria)]|uniref:glycosyltransferase 87 family protein n=1 Tax=Gordonia sp. (in: high G+C Gram-positive bacteria) TaxID=84139 RepID=UPI0039E36658